MFSSIPEGFILVDLIKRLWSLKTRVPPKVVIPAPFALGILSDGRLSITTRTNITGDLCFPVLTYFLNTVIAIDEECRFVKAMSPEHRLDRAAFSLDYIWHELICVGAISWNNGVCAVGDATVAHRIVDIAVPKLLSQYLRT